jgi:hypothetical protein
MQTAVHLVASRQTGTATSILRLLLNTAGKEIRLKPDSVRIQRDSWTANVLKFFFFWRNSPTRARAPSFLRFLYHIQWHTTVGRTPLDKGSVHCGDLYLTTHNTRRRKTSMPPTGLEPAIPASDRPQTPALVRWATGMDILTRFAPQMPWFMKNILIQKCVEMVDRVLLHV